METEGLSDDSHRVSWMTTPRCYGARRDIRKHINNLSWDIVSIGNARVQDSGHRCVEPQTQLLAAAFADFLQSRISTSATID